MMHRVGVRIALLACLGCASTPEPPEEPDYMQGINEPDKEVLDAHWADVYRVRGDNALLKRRFDEAEKNYKLALDLVPEHPDSLVGLAHIRQQAGKIEESRQLLLRSVRSNPEHILSWQRLAHLRLKIDGNLPAALEAVDEILRIDPTNIRAQNWKRNIEADLARASTPPSDD